MYQDLAVLAAFLIVYSVCAARLESRLFSGPLVFMLAGLLMGPALLGILQPQVNHSGLRMLAELTLALVLFSDAANANLRVLRAHENLPLRLLLIGLPLTLGAGWGLGLWLLPQVPLLELALLATILAPTDAALGKVVVRNPAVPAPVRESLNVESGLNDGICVPILLALLALRVENQGQAPWLLVVEFLLVELGIGSVVGALLAFLVWRLHRFASEQGWEAPIWSQLTLPGLAILCFATAQALGGSGFIAAFVGGLLAGYLFGRSKHHLLQGAEEFSSLLSVLTWVLFGALVVPLAWSMATPQIWLYALLSLTLIRILPVCISLLGTRMDLELRLFIAWFGPRGLATVVFLIMLMDVQLQAENSLVATAICTVLLSVLLHGLSALPWSQRIGRRQPSG